jgi:hypothetical protein
MSRGELNCNGIHGVENDLTKELQSIPSNYNTPRSTHRGGEGVFDKTFWGKFPHRTMIEGLKVGFLNTENGVGAFLNIFPNNIAFIF